MKSKDSEPLKIDFVIDFNVFESDEYKRHFAMVGRNPLGHTIDQRVVYTPQLAFILTQPLTGFDRVLNRRIEGKANVEFSKLYFEAYDKGFEYFKTEYLQTDVYLLPQLEFWVKKIDRLYNHDGVYRFGGVANGWNFVKKKYPLIITNEVLHEYGFYSGLCASAEKFNHENKEIFEAYEISVEPKKVENVEPQQNEFDIVFDEHFKQYEALMFPDEFKRAKTYLRAYFESELIEEFEPIKFKKKGIKKRLCYHLGMIHKDLNQGNKYTDEYYEFLKERFEPVSNISISHFETYQRTNPKKGA